LALEFEWDARKPAANLAKHKVSFEEAATSSEILWGASLQIRDIHTAKSGSRFSASLGSSDCWL
jgi:uncharacterized DUF497 family protein